ncbi:MAG: type I DNA topoisomerase [Bacteroidota bacterium]
MPKNLVIVESPAKAKTIEKILGKDFVVKSSFGHVRDLDKGNQAVDVERDFATKYVVSPEKRKVVKELKNWVKKVDEVWLATDEDREGEAISWHLCAVLGLDEQTTKRIVFREITKPAILSAIQNPRTVDLNLVDAQQARRVLDRLVGFELSGLLWKKIRGKLSAGRVQSVAVKLIVERERTIRAFTPQAFYRLDAIFNVKNEAGRIVQLKATSPDRIATLEEAKGLLNQCVGASFSISDIQLKPLKRKPAAPFTTSTLQQDASRKFGFSVKRTMQVAQRLYEAGHITYMRTDSISLSEVAIASIAQQIEQDFGKEYVNVRRYKNKKNSNAQEAHEAIRPTYIAKQNASGDRDEQRLYELIWKRTIASQMAEAKLEKTIVNIEIDKAPGRLLRAEGEVLVFDGFLKVYLESKDDEEEEETKGMLPPLTEGQVLPLNNLTATERFTRPPARYTEAGLVKALEEKGIGRPSTYAPTISKIMEENRGYVVRESRDGVDRSYRIITLENDAVEVKTDSEKAGAVKNRLFPTEMGMTVSDFLEEYFDRIMDYGFTSEIEERFDNVAGGREQWTKMLREFYEPFHDNVQVIIETAERVTKERIIGQDPDTGRTVLTRLSRRGPVIQMGAPDELLPDEKPRYANLPDGMEMEDVTLEIALKLFELPKTLGEYEDKEVVIGVGRYGPYVRWGEAFISLGRRTDPHSVDMDAAIEKIEIKKEEDRPLAFHEGEPVTKGKGRFGPFIKWQKLFVNVPKKYDWENLTEEEAIELLKAKIEKEANRYVQRWDDEDISIQNGRWGPFIKYGKQNVKLPKVGKEKMTSEQAKELTLEQVKEIIEEELPGSFTKEKKKKKTKKK